VKTGYSESRGFAALLCAKPRPGKPFVDLSFSLLLVKAGAFRFSEGAAGALFFLAAWISVARRAEPSRKSEQRSCRAKNC